MNMNKPTIKDKERISALAGRYSELANAPFMDERREAWTRLHDLDPIRPVCVLETGLMDDIVPDDKLQCGSLLARDIEWRLLMGIKHVELIDDDYPLPQVFPVHPTIKNSHPDYGVGLKRIHNAVTKATMPNHPISAPDDIYKLKKCEFSYDKDTTEERLQNTMELLGGNLPAVLTGSFCNVPGISKYVFDLVGMENIYYWAVDHPDIIIKLAGYIADNFLARYKLLEKEGLLYSGHPVGYAGSGSLTHTSDLKCEAHTTLSNTWVWMESQETETLSPEMFEELFLPSMKKVAEHFGLIYYGCCEHLHDRMDRILRYIPNIRSVSVSPWSDIDKMAEILDGKMVFSRKLNPMNICNDFQWDEIEKEVSHILKTVKNSTVEFIYRDIYRWGSDGEKFQTCMKRIKRMIS